MTRKDYIVLAAALRLAKADAEQETAREGVNLAVERIVEVLTADNPRFDADRFRAAAARGWSPDHDGPGPEAPGRVVGPTLPR